MGSAEKWKGFAPLRPEVQSALGRLSALFVETGVILVYLFGSLAEGKAGNDVDLAIWAEQTPAIKFSEKLATFLGTERVDIVDLRRASPAFCFEIIRTGQILYAANDKSRLPFELKVVRHYHDTAYLRQRQEEALRRRMMAWSSSTIMIERLQELDIILPELSRYQGITPESLDANLSQRWMIERGLIAAASLILDIADHILVGHFGFYANSYEESLQGLRDKGVISPELFGQIKGLGGFRNVLVHLYQEIGPALVADSLQKGLHAFPQFAQEILLWLESIQS